MAAGTSERVQRVAAPLRQQVVERLREAIVAAKYKPGERLVEAPLCERFGVSRTVIREALRQLESEGLVEMLPNRGPIVADISLEQVRSLYEVRAALEGMAGALFAVRATSEECDALIATLEDVASAYQRGQLDAKLAATDRFYVALLAGAHNDVARTTLRAINARVQQLRGMSLSTSGRVAQSLGELRKIADTAGRRRDPVAARAACEQHVQRAGQIATSALAARLAESEN